MVPHTFLRPFMEFFPTQFLPLAHAAGRATARPPGGRLAAWRAIWVGAFPGGRPVLLIVVVTLAFGGGSARAADEAAGAGGAQPAAARFFIQEYRVEGAKLLPRPEVEAAVYPFLGPGCTEDDIEKARAALEKAYHAQGWLTVLVQVPNQDPTAIAQTGVVVLKVTETPVGRLRVRGAQYFPPSQITAMAPSLAEGRVPNYNDVQHDIVALNQLTDLRVTPELLPVGYRPDTVDVNLDAKDSSPLHGSLELNNRESPGTSALRLNGAVSDSNLWQLGHSAGFSFQASPEDWNQVKVFSGYYLMRPYGADGPGLMLQGTKQDSNVSTLGGAAVAGRGDTVGLRALYTLPGSPGFYHSATLGFDYKQFNQVVNAGGGAITSPVTYYPFSAAYSATWVTPGTPAKPGVDGKPGVPEVRGVETDLNAQVVLSVRGLGSGTTAFVDSRYEADESFIYIRGDVSQTRELPAGFQLYGKAQGQAASGPLLSAEEFSGGGLGTVRGYLEGEVSGDEGYAGTVELRTPPLESRLGLNDASLRLFVFADAGQFTVLDPLPQQTSRFDLASVGLGARLAAHGHFTGTLTAGLPLVSQTDTPAHDWLVVFTAAISY